MLGLEGGPLPFARLHVHGPDQAELDGRRHLSENFNIFGAIHKGEKRRVSG